MHAAWTLCLIKPLSILLWNAFALGNVMEKSFWKNDNVISKVINKIIYRTNAQPMINKCVAANAHRMMKSKDTTLRSVFLLKFCLAKIDCVGDLWMNILIEIRQVSAFQVSARMMGGKKMIC